MFEFIFFALCIGAVVQTRRLKKIAQRLAVLEFELRDYVTQSPRSSDLGNG